MNDLFSVNTPSLSGTEIYMGGMDRQLYLGGEKFLANKMSQVSTLYTIALVAKL